MGIRRFDYSSPGSGRYRRASRGSTASRSRTYLRAAGGPRPMPWLDREAAVGVIDCGRFYYPRRAPFHPPETYPEYPFGSSGTDSENFIYAAVRDLLYELGLDRARFGTAQWNPLGELIGP